MKGFKNISRKIVVKEYFLPRINFFAQYVMGQNTYQEFQLNINISVF